MDDKLDPKYTDNNSYYVVYDLYGRAVLIPAVSKQDESSQKDYELMKFIHQLDDKLRQY